MLNGLGRPPQGRDLVQPHKRKLSLMDTIYEARNISAVTKRLIFPQRKTSPASKRRVHRIPSEGFQKALDPANNAHG